MDRHRRTRRRTENMNAGAGAAGILAYFAAYTLCFAALAALVFGVFHKNGFSMVWDRDGLNQTYTTMVYVSRYWKEFLENLWINHEFVLPMVDFRVSLGSDILTSLNHHGFGDPLLLLSVPAGEDSMEQCYAFLAVLRYYLAGAAFSVYCLYMKRKALPAMAGALAYAFCGYALYAGVRHPYFLNSMWYFPLMLVGVEQIFRGRKGLSLSVFTAVAALSNYYFLFMLTILTFVYALVRMAFGGICRGEEGKRQAVSILCRGCGYYFLGLGMGAALLIPNILAFFGNARSITISGVASLLHYDMDFYRQMVAGLMLPEFTANYWTVLCLAPMTVFGCALVFTAGKREDKWLKWLLAVMAVMLLVPAGGYFMNGMSYVTNRWIYGFAFVMALMAVRGMELLPEITAKHLILPAVLLAASCFAAWWSGNFSDSMAVAAAVLGTVNFLLLVIFAAASGAGERTVPPAGVSLLGAAVLAVTAGAVLVNARALYSPGHGNYVSEFWEEGQCMTALSRSAECRAPKPGEGEIFRTSGDAHSSPNNGMVMDFYGTDGYFSIVSEHIFNYMKAMEVDDMMFPNWYYGFGGRAALDALAAVKYFGNNSGTALAAPYGYADLGKGDGVWENTMALPLAFTYDQAVRESEFMELPAVRKQELMMQAAVLADEGSAAAGGEGLMVSANVLEYDAAELPWTVASMKNVNWDQETGVLTVNEGGGDLYLSFEGRENAETYLRFGNYNINDSGYELLTVNVECGDAYWKKFYEASTKSVWYGNVHNFIVSLGWRQEARDSVHINFPYPGTFRLDELQIFSVPMESYERFMRERGAGGAENVTLEENRVRAEVSADRQKLLYFSIPYSKGWKALVDGEPAKVLRSNIMFSAVEIPAGDHEVELVYRTPGFFPGAAISAVCLAVALMLGFMGLRRGRNR